jgi:hypothetical protein
MSAKPRDLLKTRRQRLGEVYSALHRNDGAFDVQLVSFGGDLTVNGTAQQFDIAAWEAVINQAVVNHAALTAQTVPAGATTDAATFRKVLLEVDAAGTLTKTVGVGAADQASAVKPAPTVNRIEIGWLELPNSFTAGTTALTAGMLKKTPYWAAP